MFLDKKKKIEMEKKKKLERRQEEEKSEIEQLQRDRNNIRKRYPLQRGAMKRLH